MFIVVALNIDEHRGLEPELEGKNGIALLLYPRARLGLQIGEDTYLAVNESRTERREDL